MKPSMSLTLAFFLFLSVHSNSQLLASVSKSSDCIMVNFFDQDPKNPQAKKETTTKKKEKKSKTADKKIVDEKISVSEESQSQEKKKKSSDPKK